MTKQTALLITLAAVTQVGFVKHSPNLTINFDGLSRTAEMRFPKPSPDEVETKKYFTDEKSKQPKKFKETVEHKYELDLETESVVAEINEPARKEKQIEKAKPVAMALLYDGIKQNFPGVQKSTINTVDAANFLQFEPYLKSQLQNIIYRPTENQNELVFDVADWGRVIFTKSGQKITKAKWMIEAGMAR